MKIKIWAFVLIVAGALVLGGALGFMVTGGLTAADKLLQYTHAQTAGVQPPYAFGGNNGNNGAFGGRNHRRFGMMPGNGLPYGFNAGVNIESEYAALTNRTAEQVQSAEQAAHTNIWGLAQSEGKLDQLKTKVTDDVTASLKQMVANGKITQAQSDSYLTWVKQYLQAVAPEATPAPTTTGSGV